MCAFVACDDLFTSDSDDGRDSIRHQATCELDDKAFAFILEKDISTDLDCLRDNLNDFIDLIKTDRPGSISREVLKKFVTSGATDVDTDLASIIDSVFDMSHLILGTEKEYLGRTDMETLIDFLKYFNQHIWRSYRYFNNESEVNYLRHIKERDIVFNEFSLITQELRKIYRPHRDKLDTINTEELIFNVFKDKTETLEKIRSLMFLKRAFLGGEVWKLSHLEVSSALDVLPPLAQVALDIAKIDRYEFQNEQQTLIKVFLRDIDIVNKYLFFNGHSHESVFTIYDAINAILTVAPDLLPFDISKYPREIMQLKEIILGNGGEIVSAKEVKSAMEQGKYLLNEADLFYRVYDYYRSDMSSSKPISHDFSDFPLRNSQEKEFLEHFARIATSYKFIKGDVTSPYYTYDFYRNENSFFQTGVLEYLIELVMAYYGRPNKNARGGYDMTLSDTVQLVRDFKWFLRDYGIINIGRVGGGEIEGVADNLVLMSTLFQYQSNGCETDYVCMEIPEITEFVVGLLTAVEVKDFFTDTMISLCQNGLDQYDRIAPECFRKNFLNVIETPIPGDGRSIADYMPYMHKFIINMVDKLPEGSAITESKDFMKFITETESFTRSCMYYDQENQTDEVYLKVNDAFAVFAGLLNVESTFLRFDLDRNNVVDAKNVHGKNEVLNAFYKTYKGALTALVVDKVGGQEWVAKLVAKPIFQYLVKFGKVPEVERFKSIWRFIRFILKRSRNADISRTTISTMLKTISEQSENGQKHPYKCDECFRDPTVQCVPEGDDWL